MMYRSGLIFKRRPTSDATKSQIDQKWCDQIHSMPSTPHNGLEGRSHEGRRKLGRESV
jgi:hypothetical protein